MMIRNEFLNRKKTKFDFYFLMNFGSKLYFAKIFGNRVVKI